MKQARFRGFLGTIVCVTIMMFTAILIFTIPEHIVGIYTNDQEVMALAVSLIFYAGLFQISDGLAGGWFWCLTRSQRYPNAHDF